MNALTMRSLQSAVVLTACLSLLTAGCGHPTVMVTARSAPPDLTASDPKNPVVAKIDGIPFYVKRGVCKRETIWAEPKHTLQLEVLQGDKTIVTRTITFSRSFLLDHTNTDNKVTKGDLKKLLDELHILASASTRGDLGMLCPHDVATDWETVAGEARDEETHLSCDVASSGCVKLEDAVTKGDLLRLSNTANIVVEVDYDHPYYINTKTPWIGNASVDAKLNTDGTLSEGNVQANDQTWSTILTTASNLAGSFATYAAAEVTASGAVKAAEVTAAAANPPVSGPLAAYALIPSCASEPGWPMPGPIAQADTPALPKEATASESEHKSAPKDKDKPAPKAAPAPKDAPAPKIIAYRVTPLTVVYLHDHVKEEAVVKGASLVDICKPDGKEVTDGNITVSKQDAPAPDDPNVIKVSGQVKLPKADSAAKK